MSKESNSGLYCGQCRPGQDTADHPLLQTISTGLGGARKSADAEKSEILR